MSLCMMMSKRVALVVCPLPNKVEVLPPSPSPGSNKNDMMYAGFHSHIGMVVGDPLGFSLGIYCMLCLGLLYTYVRE